MLEALSAPYVNAYIYSNYLFFSSLLLQICQLETAYFISKPILLTKNSDIKSQK